MAVIKQAYLNYLCEQAMAYIANAYVVMVEGSSTSYAALNTVEKELQDGYIVIKVTIPHEVIGTKSIRTIRLRNSANATLVEHKVNISRPAALDDLVYEFKFRILADE